MKRIRIIIGVMTLGWAICGAPVLIAGSPAAVTQDEKRVTSPGTGGWFQRATDMMAIGNYAGTIDQLSRLLNTGTELTFEEREEIIYMLGRAYYERGNGECVDLMRAFIGSYPASRHEVDARLTIADYYYFEHKFGQAYAEYCLVPLSTLNGDTRTRYEYRKALSALKSGYTMESSELFRHLLTHSDYEPAATFYLAYIDYCAGKSDAAYAGFEKSAEGLSEIAESGDTSGRRGMRRKFEYVPTAPIAAYYMLQIDFERGKYADVIKNGRTLLNRQPVEEFIPEVNRLIGESYFKQGDYERAERYLTDYLDDMGADAKSSALYDLGVLRYKAGKLNAAEEFFSHLTTSNNDIAQSAYLYLGQIAVAKGDDNTAALDFSQAYNMGYDRKVTEAAMYNYIAAATRGGAIPFTSSIEMLEDFHHRYPDSQFSNNIDEYLATAYYNEKDYSKALASINKISEPSERVLEAKQKILYQLGVEKLSNGLRGEAVKYLSEAVALKRYNKEIGTDACLWLGEALYSQGDYAASTGYYTTYIDGTKESANRTLALYDRAYSLYMQGKYGEAVAGFEGALGARPALEKKMANDARIRLADCLYYTGKYSEALAVYNQAVSDKAAESDYARYRAAMMRGLTGDTKGKVTELAELASGKPESPWAASALLEKGSTFAAEGKTAEAVQALNRVIQEYPQTAEARKAMLKIAMTEAQAGNRTSAENSYRAVIKDWPSSEEARLAHEDLRRLYAERGALADYATFLKGIPGAPTLDDNQMEELTFEAAETAFAQNPTATSRLEKYVLDYPEGKHLAQALLDLIEGSEARNDRKGALAYAETLLKKRPDAPQAIEALYKKSVLLEGSDRQKALTAYRQLAAKGNSDYMGDAYAGIMRTSDNMDEVLVYARRVQGMGGVEAAGVEEGAYYEAKALLAKGDAISAANIFRHLAHNPKSLSGAKSAVALGEYLLENKRNDEAVEVLSTFTEAGTPHQYWLARGYIALADAYHAQGKEYLAIEYVRSLADNYPGREADILKMIDTRLNSWKK